MAVLSGERATTGTKERARILAHGLDVASAQGLQAVTMGELARELHVPRSGLFSMFSTKEKLQLAILEQAIHRFVDKVITPAKQEPKGRQRIEALFKNWLAWARSDHLKGSCPFVNASSQSDRLDSQIKTRLNEALAGWREELLAAIEEAKAIGAPGNGTGGGLRRDLDAEQFVFELFGLYLSHHYWHWSMHDRHAQWRTLKAFDRLLQNAQTGK